MAAAAAGGASSLLASPSPRRLPYPHTTSNPLAASPKTLTLSSPRRLPCPLASSTPGPLTQETEKLAFARAAAYKKERDSPGPTPPATPPPAPVTSQPQAPAERSGGKEALARALEYKNGNGGRPGAARGGSGLLGGSPDFGMYSLRKRIEDAVVRVETFAPSALELEESRKIKQEEVLRRRNLWDNPAKSHETLSALADAIRVVDHLKDLRYKAEEAKLISQLSEMDAINGELFKQAYKSSIDASEYLDRYQMYKLLKGRYDKEGACIIVTAVSEDLTSELWAEKIFAMYTSWAQKQGCKIGLIEKITSSNGRIRSAAMEIESEYMFGTLCGEKGTHQMIYPSFQNSGSYQLADRVS